MSIPGIKATNLPLTSLADTLIVVRGGNARQMDPAQLSAQIGAINGPTYETRAQLYADLAWAAGSVGKVVGDETLGYRGIYKKSGASGAGAWARIGPLPEADAEGLAGQVADVVGSVSALDVLVAALDGNVVILNLDAATTRATLNLLEGTYPLGANNLGIVDGVKFADDRLLYGYMPSGSKYEGPFFIEILAENNLGLLGDVVIDADGRVVWGVDDTSTPINAAAAGGSSLSAVYEDDGDIYAVLGTLTIRVTETGDNFAPSALGGTHVRWLSRRRRDELIAYRADVLDPSAVVIAYARRLVIEIVIVTGQSLAEGGAAAISTTPYYDAAAMKFVGGPVGKQGEVVSSNMTSLSEEINETICSGMARQLLGDEPDRRMLFAGQAWGGKTLAEISKGAADGVYEKIMTQIANAVATEPRTAVYACHMVNGEADGLISNTDFADDLEAYRQQFAEDVMALTGQFDEPVLLISQVSSVSGYRDGTAARDTFVTPFQQLLAAETYPKIYLTGPKYPYDYYDHSHMTGAATRRHGEIEGKVYRHVVIEGEDWQGLRPSAINVSGSNVVIDCHVPVAPIVVDTVWVTDPGNLGFNLLDAGGASITGVTVTGPAQITVALSAPPQAGWRLSYAFHNGTYGTSGRTTGARGCIRDSDTTPSKFDAEPLRNWLLSFQHTF